MCSRLLTTAFSPILRDFYDFAATITGPPERGYPTPAVSNSIMLFTGHDDRLGAQHDRGVRASSASSPATSSSPTTRTATGTHVNDLLFIRPVFHDGAIVGFVNLKAHQLDMGGIGAGRLQRRRSATSTRTGSCSRRARCYSAGRAGPRDLDLIFDNVRFGEILLPDMLTIVRRASTSASGCCSRRSSATASTAVLRRDRLRLRRRRRAHRRGARDAARRRVRGRGRRSTPTASTTTRSTACSVRDHQARRARRGRLQRHLAPGAHVRSTRTRARRQDTRRRGVEVPARPARRVHLGPRSAPIDIVLPEGTMISALPPDGAVFVYCEQTQVILSAMLRALRRRVGARGDRRRPRRRRTSTTPSASIRTARRGSPRPVRRRARRRAARPATATARRQMLSYQANGIGDRGRGDRGRRPGRDPAPRDVARHRRARASPRRRGDACATRCGCAPPSTT